METFKTWFAVLIYLILFNLICCVTLAGDVEREIKRVAKQNQFDPDLAVAIAKVESGLNQKAVGSKGEIGLYQLRPEFHASNIRETKTNIKTAILYLKRIKAKCEPKFGDAWFICYNLGPNYAKPIRHPKLFPYYKRVLAQMD